MTLAELSAHHFLTAADLLMCEPAAVQAVAEVEAGPHGGFLETGEPVVLFERHLFHRLTSGKFDASYPDLSASRPGGYGKVSAQHGRLARAAQLDRDAALKSASWGAFQVLGLNHAVAGWPTLQGFVNAMYSSAAEHLLAMVRFVQSNKLDRHLRDHDWAAFAKGYNGKNYRINKYDTKLAAAYRRAKTEQPARRTA